MAGSRRIADEQKTAEVGIQPRGEGGLGLVVLTADGMKMFPLPAAGDVTIGRSRDADVQVDAESLSRQHAVLQLGPPLRVKDLGSSNGTRVRDDAVGSSWVEIRVGEAVQLGSVTVLVQRAAEGVRPQRRVCSHDYFEARLDEACRSGGAGFAVLRVHVGGALDDAPSLLAGELSADSCLAMYAPGEYEALIFGADAQAAALLAARLEAGPLQARVGIACFPAQGRDPERLIAAANAPLAPAAPGSKVVIASAAMKELFDVVDRIAVGTINVLITGETGAGKEVVAAEIHARSRRSGKTYLTLNCAAFTETLLESELFGHEKGAFTGATAAKPGLLEAAQGGTVFLDEVGDLPLSTQVKLLRVLEERTLRRVGGLKSRAIDVRFVTATNRDLEAEVTAGRFRQDLYFRIGGVTLLVPPLRSRLSELEPLAKLFIGHSARQLGRRPPLLSKAALALMESYRWPGNIRELRNVMERAVLLCGGATIEPENLPREKLSAMWVTPPPQPLSPAPPTGPDDGQRQRILEALSSCGGNQTRAAKLLGISRRTLLYRLDALAIPRPQKGSA